MVITKPSLYTVICMIFISIYAIGGVVSSADVEITHLTYGGHGAEFREYLEEMARKFELDCGIKVNVIQVSGNDYTPKVTSMIAGGVAPEVTDYHPAIAGGLIGQGIFEDLKPWVERSKVPLHMMPPAAVAGVTMPNGGMWSIPGSIYPMVTFFNADLFAEMGMQNPRQLGENWNWQTFASSAKRIRMDLDGDGKIDRYGTSRLDWRWDMQVHQAGGRMYDNLVFPTKSYLNTPEVRKAVEYLQELIAVEKVDPLSGSYTVWNGKAGMTLAYGPAVLRTYFSNVSFSWDMAMQPKGSASRAARVNPDGFQILKSSRNKEAAWKWLYYLVASPERQLELAKITGRLPALKEAMLKYPKVMNNLPSNWMAFIETAFDPASYSPYVVPSQAVNSAVNSTMSKIWRGQVAAGIALQQLDEQVSELLKQ